MLVLWLPEEGGVDEFPAETDEEDEDCQKIVKSPTPIFNDVLGLPSKTTWATMVKKNGYKGYCGNNFENEMKSAVEGAGASDGLFLVPASRCFFSCAVEGVVLRVNL
ncbi:hypothetical protein Tco_0675157 [Tanacetum coccineum]